MGAALLRLLEPASLRFLRDRVKGWIPNRRGAAPLPCRPFCGPASLPGFTQTGPKGVGTVRRVGLPPSLVLRVQRSPRAAGRQLQGPVEECFPRKRFTGHFSESETWQDPQTRHPLQSTAQPLLGGGRPQWGSAPLPSHPCRPTPALPGAFVPAFSGSLRASRGPPGLAWLGAQLGTVCPRDHTPGWHCSGVPGTQPPRSAFPCWILQMIL